VEGCVRLEGDFATGDWVAVTGNKRFNGIYQLEESHVAYDENEENEEDEKRRCFRLSSGMGDIVSFNGIEFEAVVFLLLPQVGFISLCMEINEYMNNPDNFANSKVSESVIGFYSHTRATGSSGKPLTVFQVFSSRLEAFRRVFSGFEGI